MKKIVQLSAESCSMISIVGMILSDEPTFLMALTMITRKIIDVMKHTAPYSE